MSNKKVLVVGASGMLGSMVIDFLSRQTEYSLAATVRSEPLAEKGEKHFPEIEWRLFDAEKESDSALAGMVDGSEWVINCIGKTKPYAHDDNAAEIERAIMVNSLFPYRLATAAAKKGAKVLSIATDCVFSGLRGDYGESDKHDALDVYGKTKSLGECYLPNAYNLRCSIIGPESKSYVFLLEWFRQQAKDAQVNGFTNHLWNGVTTLHFARICHGVIKNDLDLPHIQHVIPGDTISKADLLGCFAQSYGRPDITITPVKAGTVVNRVLLTENPQLNAKIWKSAGYGSAPTVAEMVVEMARFDFRMEAVFS
jgi:dTDP-4-dehydrorhamnose reductase